MKQIFAVLLVGYLLLGSCATGPETKKGRVTINGICDKCNTEEVDEMKRVFETRLQRLGFTNRTVSISGEVICIELFDDYPDWHILRDTLPSGISGHRFIITDEKIEGPVLE